MGEDDCDRLAQLVTSLLGAARRLLLVAPEPRALAEVLRARGLEVEAIARLGIADADGRPSEGTDAGGLPPAVEGGWDAVCWIDGFADAGVLGPSLATLHRLLADKGKLLLATLPVEQEAHDRRRRELAIALSESGFAILRELAPEEAGGARILLARRETFRVREYQPGDEVQILAIFEGSFFVPRSLARWSWEYRENPYGNLMISEAFGAGEDVVAHYAGYPVRFRSAAAAEPLLALQIGDTMTHPAVRHVGRGPTSLLGRTVRHFYARFCEGKVAFNYGFNTGNIQRFSMAFVGARRLEDLPFHVLRLPASSLTSRGRFRDRLAGWSEQRVERFDARWDELFARVAPSYGMLVERDARYLDWRYARCPGGGYSISACFRRGRLMGWGAFRRREDRLLWGDALVDPSCPEVVGRVLSHALSLPEHVGVRSVETWATARPEWWRPLILRLGFVAEPEPNALGLVFVPFGIDPGREMRDRLYYAMGDSDLF